MKSKATLLMITGLAFIPTQSHAIQIFRVIEQGLQSVAQAQLGHLKQNLGVVKDQLDISKRMEKLTDDSFKKLNSELTGAYDMGKIYNGTLDRAKRRWGPSLDGLSADKAYQMLKRDFSSKFNPKNGQALFHGDAMQSYAYDQNKSAQEKSIVSAKYISQSINHDIDGIETLIAKIDHTPNQKASSDLNSRIQGQVALEMVELKRLQAMLLESMGTSNQQLIVDKNQNVEFNQWV